MPTKIFHSLFRRWRKNKAYSLLNIFGLGIGIACAGLIFLWTEDERHYDDFNARKDRLYNVEINIKNPDGNVWTIGSTSRPLMELAWLIHRKNPPRNDAMFLFPMNE
jgi:putative ABC transport system permease protein